MNLGIQFYLLNKSQITRGVINLLSEITRMDYLIRLILIFNIVFTFNAKHFACGALNSKSNHRYRKSHHPIRPSDYFKINQYPYPSAYSSSLLNDEIPSSFLFNKKSLLGDLKRDYSNEILTNEILTTREKAAKNIDFDTVLSQKEKELIHDAIQKRLIDRLKNIYLIKTRTR